MNNLWERFFEKVDTQSGTIPDYAPELGRCWLWTASIKGTDGYGQFSVNKRPMPAHRFFYQMIHGEVPSNLHMDHLCRNRKCVRPSHLEPVTQRVNVVRGFLSDGRQRMSLVCKNGHALTKDNTWFSKSSTERRCRTCQMERARKKSGTKPENFRGRYTAKHQGPDPE